MAAAYSSGGRKPSNTTSADNSGMLTNGRKETRDPDEHQEQRRGEPEPIRQRRYGEHRGNHGQDAESDCHIAMLPSDPELRAGGGV